MVGGWRPGPNMYMVNPRPVLLAPQGPSVLAALKSDKNDTDAFCLLFAQLVI